MKRRRAWPLKIARLERSRAKRGAAIDLGFSGIEIAAHLRPFDADIRRL
jgi:hypothetical protein